MWEGVLLFTPLGLLRLGPSRVQMQTEYLDGVQLREKKPSLCFVFGSMDFPSPTSYLRSANLGQPKHGAFEVSLPPALAEAPNSKGMRDGTIAQAPQAFGQNPFPSQFSELSQDRFFSSLVRDIYKFSHGLNRTLHHFEGP